MDENFEKKRSDIDLTEFDLTPFKELFAEEDAQKEADKKAQEEQIIKEEEIIAQKEEEKISLEKEAEDAAALEEAKIKAEKKAAREKEEARKAAEKTAQAILAAKKAEEAKREAEKAKSERLLEKAEADNTFPVDSAEEKPEETTEENLDSFSSILSITNETEETAEEEQKEKIELTDEYFNYKPEMPSPKSGIYSAICAVLILAFIGCTAFAGYTYFIKGNNKAEASNTEYIGTSPEYAPYSSLQAKYPATANLENINDDLKSAYAINNETVGWISIDGTPVDYPIVQADDNTKYLSYTNFYGKGARYGTPFMDFRCDPLNLSKNTIIYSHNMNNNLFFGSLDNYADSNYYEKHPYIEYQTLNGNYKFKVYAVFYATTEAESDGGFVFDYYNPNMSDENFNGYIELLNQYAIYKTDAGLASTDKIITLSTCSHVYDSLKKGGVDTRFVVVGRMLREGEEASTGNESVTENTEYRRPQLWYDANKKENPYAAYRSWKASL